MGISVYTLNKLHKRIREVSEVDPDALAALISAAPAKSLMGSIHFNADTMFNMYQLELFSAELSDILPRDEREGATISALNAAAESMVRRHGYLWFSGD